MIGSKGKLENIIYSDSILSAVYSADRFFYAIFDSHHRLINASIDPIDKSELADLVSRGFKKKIVAVDGTSIHLPKQIEGNELIKQYTYSLPKSEVFSDHMLGVAAKTHYALDLESEQTITAFFDYSEIIHISTAIGSFLYPALKDKVMFIY